MNKFVEYEDVLGLIQDQQLSQKYWRSLILDETLKYNQDEFWKFVDSGTLKGYKKKVDLIVYGYIRQYIEPLFSKKIPLDIVNLLNSIF